MESTNPGYRRLAILPLLLLVLPAVAVAQTTIPAGVSADWWSHVQRDITQHEYHASVTEQGLVAPNRAHGLRTTFSESGIAVVPRTREGVAPAWRFAWTTRSFGRPGSEFGVAAVSPVSTGDRVTYRREGFSEWYVNTAAGLEQGFTIERRPAGEGPLRIVGEIAGELPGEVTGEVSGEVTGEVTGELPGELRGALHPEPRADGAIDFIESRGACAVRYGELHAWDANGASLPSEIVVAGTELALVVDDRGAAYPLTIDPLVTAPVWIGEGDQAATRYGHSVATAGDVNGDGYSDVIVGAPYYDNGEEDEGRAFLYYGSDVGLATVPSWIGEGDQGFAWFGSVVAGAGDVNGDGYADVIIGARLYDNEQMDEGRAFVYHGSAAGLAGVPAWTAESNQSESGFGDVVGTAGDVNGDGYADVIVGAFSHDNGQTDEGRAFVYHGSAAGLAVAPSWIGESDQDYAWFGESVATAGDVNADGYADVIVSATLYDNGQFNEGRAFVYHGSAAGLGNVPAWSGEGDHEDGWYGSSVSTAGDVNGDGYSDVIVGAPHHDDGQFDEGWAFVYHGAATGLAVAPSWIGESEQAGAYYGLSVATVGDVNGDGYSDVIVGAPYHDDGEVDEGRAFVYHGSAAGLGSAPGWIGEGNQSNAWYGSSVATAGDVNGDGFSDAIVGAPLSENMPLDEGRAYLYYGSSASLADAPGWTGESDQENAGFGYSVATAGDVNGDGYSDVIVGAPYYDNGQSDEGKAWVYHGSAAGLASVPAWTGEGDQLGAYFGWSVATAGDVNGDGYSDVIVGAVFYENGQPGEGKAFVYRGSAAGLAGAPAWSDEGDQDFAQFGSSVATAGDVNGDGYSDVVIGAYAFDNGETDEGKAFVYHGSAAGLAGAPAWAREGDQPEAYFGASVATAGDVNGDGYSDVIVAAHYYDNGQTDEGKAFVYHGSAAGLATAPAWTGEGDQAGAYYGSSVATAGDVNGNGCSDIIIGAYAFDNGQTDEGMAFVYHGTTAGLFSDPSWVGESDQAFARYGYSVATAGDVNNDGFSDAIVGAPLYDTAQQISEGYAWVYHGSSVGLYSAPAWSGGSGQGLAEYGYSAATAGDVNGDGCSDVVVAAPWFTNGQTDEGYVWVYNGNGGDGLDRIPRQARVDDSAPIAILGRSDSGSAFRLKALGRTAMGRGQVRLQWEVKPLDVPFDGSGLATSGIFDTGAPVAGIGSAVPLNELVSGLASDAPYHWRLRILSNSPFVPWTPWLALPDNNRAETDLRTGPATTGVEVAEGAPGAALRIQAASPNPFARSTDISYTLPLPGRVWLAIYDVTGRQCAVLVDGTQAAGRQRASWDGRDADGGRLPAGVYFVRLAVGDLIAAEKLVLLP